MDTNGHRWTQMDTEHGRGHGGHGDTGKGVPGGCQASRLSGASDQTGSTGCCKLSIRTCGVSAPNASNPAPCLASGLSLDWLAKADGSGIIGRSRRSWSVLFSIQHHRIRGSKSEAQPRQGLASPSATAMEITFFPYQSAPAGDRRLGRSESLVACMG